MTKMYVLVFNVDNYNNFYFNLLCLGALQSKVVEKETSVKE